MNALTTFIQDTWLAATMAVAIVIIWTAGCACAGVVIERMRIRRQQRRHAEALRELSRLSREMREEL